MLLPGVRRVGELRFRGSYQRLATDQEHGTKCDDNRNRSEDTIEVLGDEELHAGYAVRFSSPETIASRDAVLSEVKKRMNGKEVGKVRFTGDLLVFPRSGRTAVVNYVPPTKTKGPGLEYQSRASEYYALRPLRENEQLETEGKLRDILRSVAVVEKVL